MGLLVSFGLGELVVPPLASCYTTSTSSLLQIAISQVKSFSLLIKCLIPSVSSSCRFSCWPYCSCRSAISFSFLFNLFFSGFPAISVAGWPPVLFWWPLSALLSSFQPLG
eukprot:TRINITY_DN152_c0_g4_i2.p1 TRINITY_DN152_c0_g4~~TRINITY_DN152_c0_g4_i2.p1  ORF type:complete len:110 (-),score=18.90 TRINITY_DN152_c0_g4_i2:807-1136(-)